MWSNPLSMVALILGSLQHQGGTGAVHAEAVATTLPDHQQQQQQQPLRINLSRSLEAARKFDCREPQTRSYQTRELLQNFADWSPSESANQPVYVVFKRCDLRSGCCSNPDFGCSPLPEFVYYEDVELEVWSVDREEIRRQWIRIQQHGRCSCQPTTTTSHDDPERWRPNVQLLLQ